MIVKRRVSSSGGVLRAQPEEKKFSFGSVVAAAIVLCSVAFAVVQYGKYAARKAEAERIEAQRREQHEARLAEESAKREREAETERARIRHEQEKARLEREKRERERKAKSEAELERQRKMDGILNGFKSAPVAFAADLPDGKSPLRGNGRFFAIAANGASGRTLYEMTLENGKVAAVRNLSATGAGKVDAEEFAKTVLKERLLVLDGEGRAWICGTGKPSWNEKLQISGNDVTPAKTELGWLFEVLSSWERLPDFRFRVALKPTDGGKEIPLETIGYGGTIGANAIREAVVKLVVRRRKQNPTGVLPPKFKQFKPTVVLYDGDEVQKGINGVTKVPRRFKLGSEPERVGSYADWVRRRESWAKKREYQERHWKKLKDEAERQEEKLEEVQRENERLRYEYDAAVRKAKGISDGEIEKEAEKYVLSVERVANEDKLPMAL